MSQPPNPKATLALLNRLEDLIDLRIPLGELAEDARAWQLGVDQLAAEDSEVAEYVQTLEEARDTAELPEASGEAIAREFERYLRRTGRRARSARAARRATRQHGRRRRRRTCGTTRASAPGRRSRQRADPAHGDPRRTANGHVLGPEYDPPRTHRMGGKGSAGRCTLVRAAAACAVTRVT